MLADVYYEHKGQLLTVLPLEDPFFIADLQRNGLLRFGNLVHVIRAKPTRAEKVEEFLTTAIEPSVQYNEGVELEKLLLVMNRSNDICSRLANVIRYEISSSNTTG